MTTPISKTDTLIVAARTWGVLKQHLAAELVAATQEVADDYVEGRGGMDASYISGFLDAMNFHVKMSAHISERLPSENADPLSPAAMGQMYLVCCLAAGVVEGRYSPKE